MRESYVPWHGGISAATTELYSLNCLNGVIEGLCGDPVMGLARRIYRLWVNSSSLKLEAVNGAGKREVAGRMRNLDSESGLGIGPQNWDPGYSKGTTMERRPATSVS